MFVGSIKADAAAIAAIAAAAKPASALAEPAAAPAESVAALADEMLLLPATQAPAFVVPRVPILLLLLLLLLCCVDIVAFCVVIGGKSPTGWLGSNLSGLLS